ncbi:MAG: GGDEF domain-containing protein [Lachnospiraceae bacterium]|nr:GGDEF domain-containing protein [Lachnospiraceae bacterium]
MNELDYQLDHLRAVNQELREKERMYQLVSKSAVGAFLYCSFETRRICSLGQWEEFFDFEVQEMNDIFKFLEAVDESYVSGLRNILFLESQGKDTATVECLLKNKRVWVSFCVRVYYDEGGQPTDKVIYISNITKYRSQNEELTYMAYYDSMTGLYNRNYFVRLLSEFVREASEYNHIISVMIIDIDDFKNINDGQGIMIGDELVQQFGCFIKELCKENVIACHLHSDVYCIAIHNPNKRACVGVLHDAIQKRLREPFKLSSGKEFTITVSIGVAEYPDAATSALELINCAEIAVFKGKALGKDIIHYFDASIMEDFMGAIELEDKLKKAIANENFILYYQPQYFSGTKKLRGVEALIRWQDEDSHFIQPSVFIPAAEKNGSIIPIGRWVVEQSIKQYAIWRRQFGFPFIMSINISALQYKKDDFVDSVVNNLHKYDVSPNEIELEITESVLIEDFNAVYEKIKILKEYGIRISLDDFGTGFSSLAYLTRLPIDTLKIDKTFIDTVLTDSATRVITESIVSMVKALKFESIAEGVEDEAQYHYLETIGCDVIQGYLFSRPLSPVQMEDVLREEKVS